MGPAYLVRIAKCCIDGFLPEIVRRGVIFLEASREFRHCGAGRCIARCAFALRFQKWQRYFGTGGRLLAP
jgi:hypothetical protein